MTFPRLHAGAAAAVVPPRRPVIHDSSNGSAGSTGNWTVVPRPNLIVSSGLGVLELVFSGFNPAGKTRSCRTAVALPIHTTAVVVGW